MTVPTWEAIWLAVVGFFSQLWGYWQVKYLVAHIALNVGAAVLAAIRTGEFDWMKLKDFLWKKLTPYVGMFALAALFSEAADQLWMKDAVWLVLTTTLWIDLADNLKKLGIPIPDTLLLGKPSHSRNG